MYIGYDFSSCSKLLAEGKDIKGSRFTHRSAPIESVAMSKQGLTVMFSICPAT
jgi:hypothetical protein